MLLQRIFHPSPAESQSAGRPNGHHGVDGVDLVGEDRHRFRVAQAVDQISQLLVFKERNQRDANRTRGGVGHRNQVAGRQSTLLKIAGDDLPVLKIRRVLIPVRADTPSLGGFRQLPIQILDGIPPFQPLTLEEFLVQFSD
ncbi:MAG: hypothetical protein WCF54_05270 [Terracidiphilus sp.]